MTGAGALSKMTTSKRERKRASSRSLSDAGASLAQSR
jgi:hypothetical protein